MTRTGDQRLRGVFVAAVVLAAGVLAAGCNKGASSDAAAPPPAGSAASAPAGGPNTPPEVKSQIQAAQQADAADRAAHAPKPPTQ
jgi:hypothetical protein